MAFESCTYAYCTVCVLVVFKYHCAPLAVDFNTANCPAAPITVNVEMVNVELVAVKYIVAEEASAAAFKVSPEVVNELVNVSPLAEVLEETIRSTDFPMNDTICVPVLVEKLSVPVPFVQVKAPPDS